MPQIRLRLIALLCGLFGLTASAAMASEQTTDTPIKQHALSLIGNPKYPPGFSHFDYVNPNAPKGGKIRLGATGSFDNLNSLTDKGDSAIGLGLIYDSLMEHSFDQPSTSYCLLCEWVSHPADYSSVTFKLRGNAKWHDGKPVTADDVVFTFETLTKNVPSWRFYYKNVTKAEKTGDKLVTFTFDVKNNRELPQIMGDLTVMPKHFWTDKDADGDGRDPAKTSLEIPLGSGPYRIKQVIRGSGLKYERLADYWGKDLAINKGRNNFDEIAYTYFLDDTVGLEAFKGGQLDYRAEYSAKNWATAYNFPALTRGDVVREEIALKTPEPMQAFAINIRRDKFKDPRVREALSLAFNFEWANQNIFYGQYKRVSSYFQNTELASRGLPTGRELEFLEEVRNEIPPEVFTREYHPPVNKTAQDFRKHLREASRLLKAAGWRIDDGVLQNPKTGEPLKIEFLLVQPTFERIVMPYIQQLEKIGFKANIRQVDSSQYVRRIQNFDFDIVVASFRQSESPGNEQRDFWSSAAADKKGSRNIIGIKNKAVDHLIDRIIFAKDRAELVAATRALDRVLLWNHYVVPQWFSPLERVAYWNKYAHPKKLPTQDTGFPSIWWAKPDGTKSQSEEAAENRE